MDQGALQALGFLSVGTQSALRGNLYISACDSEVGQNLLLWGKFIPVTHCGNNLLQVGAGG